MRSDDTLNKSSGENDKCMCAAAYICINDIEAGIRDPKPMQDKMLYFKLILAFLSNLFGIFKIGYEFDFAEKPHTFIPRKKYNNKC